ncbi:hypothetical protein NIES2119_31435 [[Phormidium ambiguum] IAM M-71]|uniref:CopG-like ribbon-helix-helix domain-containing protein n=2 Tax=[Phormidium ambiguum] IAM M-71 TaxID=454136 RepID=A0A1U7I2B4_9CYAN|nr:hypothetical protein NIES2119_31435 [Phormidium ambiguum IAM M-71]
MTLGKTKLRKVNAYIDHDLYEKFERLAKKEMRSVSSLTAYAIAQIIEKAEGEGKL